MNIVSGFEDIAKNVLKDMPDDTVVTFGVLVADRGQDEAYQYILRYLTDFDEASGNYIDFFVPGYYIAPNDYENYYLVDDKKSLFHPNAYSSYWADETKSVYITRDERKIRYYFDEDMFREFRRKMRWEWHIEDTYNPMLILVEVSKKNYRGELAYQKKLVIELDDNDTHSVRRSGELFEEIFKIAKKESGLKGYARGLRKFYIKGAAVPCILKCLSGNFIEAIENVSNDLIKCRIKK